MTIYSLRSHTSAEPDPKSDLEFEVVLLVSVLGLALSFLLVRLVDIDLAVLALAG